MLLLPFKGKYKTLTPPYVRIHARRGRITLPRVAFEALGHPRYVELLYDPAERVIGIRARINVPNEIWHYAVNTIGAGLSAMVYARSFFNIQQIRLPADSSIAPFFMDGETLCILLKEGGPSKPRAMNSK